MEWLVNTLMKLISEVMLSVCDTFGTAVLSLLTVDIGTEGSIFSIVFSSVGDFMAVIQIMAISILIINFCWQLFKIMCTPDGSAETPFSLIASTVLAGIFIYMGPQLIIIAESLFNEFYNFVLNSGVTGQDVSFRGLFNAVQGEYVVVTNELGQVVEEGVEGGNTGDISSLAALVIAFIMMGRIAYEFIMYLTEVVERYVVLGILYYTSPLAFSVAGSKSTRNIFASWVRMVVSQLFLMFCNVLFFRLFLLGMESVDYAAVQLDSQANSLSAYLVICLMLYGILHVGTRVDSYLGTLGLSAAQTGRGLSASLVAAGLGVSRTLGAVTSMGKGLMSGVSKTVAKSKAAEAVKAEHTVRTDKNGKADMKDAVPKAVNGKLKNGSEDVAKINGQKNEFGEALKKSANGQLDKWEASSTRIDENGFVRGKLDNGAGKPKSDVALVGEQQLRGKNINLDDYKHDSKRITLDDGTKAVLMPAAALAASATGSNATLTGNSAYDKYTSQFDRATRGEINDAISKAVEPESKMSTASKLTYNEGTQTLSATWTSKGLNGEKVETSYELHKADSLQARGYQPQVAAATARGMSFEDKQGNSWVMLEKGTIPAPAAVTPSIRTMSAEEQGCMRTLHQNSDMNDYINNWTEKEKKGTVTALGDNGGHWVFNQTSDSGVSSHYQYDDLGTTKREVFFNTKDFSVGGGAYQGIDISAIIQNGTSIPMLGETINSPASQNDALKTVKTEFNTSLSASNLTYESGNVQFNAGDCKGVTVISDSNTNQNFAFIPAAEYIPANASIANREGFEPFYSDKSGIPYVKVPLQKGENVADIICRRENVYDENGQFVGLGGAEKPTLSIHERPVSNNSFANIADKQQHQNKQKTAKTKKQ